jgi:hypothetical protein
MAYLVIYNVFPCFCVYKCPGPHGHGHIWFGTPSRFEGIALIFGYPLIAVFTSFRNQSFLYYMQYMQYHSYLWLQEKNPERHIKCRVWLFFYIFWKLVCLRFAAWADRRGVNRLVEEILSPFSEQLSLDETFLKTGSYFLWIFRKPCTFLILSVVTQYSFTLQFGLLTPKLRAKKYFMKNAFFMSCFYIFLQLKFWINSNIFGIFYRFYKVKNPSKNLSTPGTTEPHFDLENRSWLVVIGMIQRG